MEAQATRFTLDALNESGAFSGAPVKKQITWKVGKKKFTADVYVRRLSYHTATGELDAFFKKKDGTAARIAACIVNEKGEPIFTAADITGEADPFRGPLDHDLTMQLLQVITQVNDLGKDTSSAT